LQEQLTAKSADLGVNATDDENKKKALEEKENLILELRKQIDIDKSQIDDLKNQIGDRTLKESEINEKEKKILELQEQLKAKNGDVGALGEAHKEVEELKLKIADLQKEIENKNSELVDLKKAAEAKANNDDTSGTALKEKDLAITDLQQKLEARSTEIDELKRRDAESSDKDKTMADLHDQIGTKSAEIAELKRQLAQKDNSSSGASASPDPQVADLRSEIVEKTTEIEDLRREVDELKRVAGKPWKQRPGRTPAVGADGKDSASPGAEGKTDGAKSPAKAALIRPNIMSTFDEALKTIENVECAFAKRRELCHKQCEEAHSQTVTASLSLGKHVNKS